MEQAAIQIGDCAKQFRPRESALRVEWLTWRLPTNRGSVSHIIVAVPVDDQAELAELVSSVAGASETVESRPFDGVVLVQTLVPLTIASLPLLKAWIVNRFEHKKAQTVVLDGMRFEGMSANDVKTLLETLDQTTQGT